jgi:hypothetical protein
MGNDRPSKVYVVAKKTKGASAGTRMSEGKGQLKFVDKRMKKEKRAMKAKAKKSGGKGKGKGGKGKR